MVTDRSAGEQHDLTHIDDMEPCDDCETLIDPNRERCSSCAFAERHPVISRVLSRILGGRDG